jgi:nitroreductase
MSSATLETVVAALRARLTPTCGFERPRIFDLSQGADSEALHELVRSEPGLFVRDELVTQVAELVHARHPTRKRKPGRDAEVFAAFLAGRDAHSYGRWVYFPWRRSLLRLLPEPEFVELRTARNQLHVSPSEQRALREKTIGIVGLSVGYGMAVTLALEGIGGRFRLADFDRVELSNTNRMATGVTALGQNKAVLAARMMLEVDPYLDVEVFDHGIRADNARGFVEDGGRLDLLIEECDDLALKLSLREVAKQLGVPVITETSQRGLLDVERFDLEPERAPLHGLMGRINAAQLAQLSTREKAPFLLRFLRGTEAMSTSLAASLLEIEQSLAGWPQLGSAVALGAAVVTDTSRRILLGSLRRSGRFHIDMEAIVSDEAEGSLRDARPPDSLSAPRLSVEREPAASTGLGVLSGQNDDRLACWVRWATLAPSGGNVQPWAFEERDDGSLSCRLSRRGPRSRLDPDAQAARVACGAAFTNLALAAARDGFRTEVDFQPDARDPDLLYRCRFLADSSLAWDELSDLVPLRCTNRRITERRALAADLLGTLASEAQRWGGQLIVHESEVALDAIGQILGELERVRIFSEPLYQEMMEELVDGVDAPAGIALDTLELSAADHAALQILRRRDVIALLRREKRGGALIDLVAKPVRSASAVCMLHHAAGGARAALEAGISLQRVWLRATQLGIAVQPISAGLYMLQQQDRAQGSERLPAWERAELDRLRAPFQEYFAVPEGRTPTLIFRLFEAARPSARSARLPLERVFTRNTARAGSRGPASR